jgi:hypothetical protein
MIILNSNKINYGYIRYPAMSDRILLNSEQLKQDGNRLRLPKEAK